MEYYDKYIGQMTECLPNRTDLGRFAVIDNGTIRDLSNTDTIKLGDYVVRESLFDENNQNIHDLLNSIADSYFNNLTAINPIIQRFNIEIKEFEKLLNHQKAHLRAIVSYPHSLLDKNTMKVNIGRAKRISTRSYQHLAHHSEDWEKMSILSPKPKKILHEELTIDLAVYENVLLKAFLHEAIKHLNKRIKETADITKFFLSIFDPKEFENVWANKIDRSSALVGRAAKSDKSKDSGTTNRALSTLKAELVKLEHAPLFEDFPKRAIESIVYHDTNVLNSHKHYKYLKILWLELKKLKETSEDKDPIIVHQDIMNNMRTYVETLFVYTLLQMKYNIAGNTGNFIATHITCPTIELLLDKYGVLHVSTKNNKIDIITLGGVYDLERTMNLPKNTVCFCFNDYQKTKDNAEGVYFVNPIDTYSIECSGIVIRKLIMQEYSTFVGMNVDFKHSLKNFVEAITSKEIVFDKKTFTYSFTNMLPLEISEVQVLSNLRENYAFKQRNKREQDSLLYDISGLIKDINCKIQKIKSTLVCLKCGKHYHCKYIKYLECECGFICDISTERARFFYKHKDETYSNISNRGWGMDLID